MEACTNPDVLKVIFFAKELLDIVFLIVPMGLLLMLGIDFFKNVSAGKEEDMKKNLNIAIKRIIFCVCIFFVPTTVSLLTKIVSDALEDTSINYALCLTNANSDKINELIDEQAQEALAKAKTDKTMANVLEAEDAINKKSDEDEKEEMLEELETIKDEILDESKKTQAEDEEARPSVDGSSDNSSGSTSGNSSQGDGKTTGTLTSPINSKDTNKEMKQRMQMNSKTLYYNSGYYHGGSDVPVETGTKVYAMDGGTVQTAAYKLGVGGANPTGYGNYVIIKHVIDGKTFYTIYAHLSKVNVKANDTVSQGQLIGESGNTGNSTGPHLHIELVTDISVLGHTANCVHILTLDYIGTGKSYKDASGYCHE